MGFSFRNPDKILDTGKYLTLKVLDDSLSVGKFLSQKSGGSKHAKTSVLEFLGLHDLDLFGILGLQAKRIKTNITWGVFGTHKTCLVNRDVLGLNKADLGTLGLGTGNTGT